MGRLFDRIKDAVTAGHYVVGWHADDMCEERAVTAWQVVAAIEDARLVRERPASKPNPSVVVRETLANGEEVEVIWSWLAKSKRARLVTVFFRG